MNPTDAVPQSVLRHRPFVLYWSARTCASMGYQMLGVAVAWQMYALTGSAFDLGLVGAHAVPAQCRLHAGGGPDRRPLRPAPPACRSARRSKDWRPPTLALASVSGWVSKEFILATVFVFGVGARLRGADPADLAAVGRCRCRCFRARSRRPRPRRSSPPSPGRRSADCSTPSARPVPYTVCAALFLASVILLAFVRIERRRADAHARQPRGVLRRRVLHPAQSDRARRHLARPVRGAARRHHGAAADLRRRDLPRRPRGPRPAARRAGGRRAADHDRADALAADAGMSAASCSPAWPASGSRPSCSRCRSRSCCRWPRWRCSAHPTR